MPIAEAKGDNWIVILDGRPDLVYSVALILFVELLVVRVISIVLALKGEGVWIDAKSYCTGENSNITQRL